MESNTNEGFVEITKEVRGNDDGMRMYHGDLIEANISTTRGIERRVSEAIGKLINQPLGGRGFDTIKILKDEKEIPRSKMSKNEGIGGKDQGERVSSHKKTSF